MVNYGDNAASETPATHALVMLATALNDSFKVPVAYFLTANISAKGMLWGLGQSN